jgi:stage II sporulation protein GA (sporulation sigma-E factor processing peptidase)
MEIIYVDTFFFLNLMADYLLVLSAARLCHLPLKRLRYFFAALLGSAYAVAALLPAFGFLPSIIWQISVLILMGFVAYGDQRRWLVPSAALFALSLSLGGLLYALATHWVLPRFDLKILVFCFLICYAAVKFFYSGALPKPDKSYVKVQLFVSGGKSCTFTALYDSGNCLTDSASGNKVILVSDFITSRLFPPDLLHISDPIEFISAAALSQNCPEKFRLLSFSSLGGSGLIVGFRPEKVLIDGAEVKDRIIGISPSAHGAGFEGIV